MAETAGIEEEFVEEVKSTFDLSAKLRGRPLRSKTVTVYTDEVAGEQIQNIEVALQQLTDMPTSLKVIAKAARDLGLESAADGLDKVALDGVRDIDKYTKLEDDKAELVETLKASAITFELQALPRIVVNGGHREARKALGIKGASVPDDRMEEFSDLATAILLTKAITSLRDADGAIITNVTVEQAKDILAYLPFSEFQKVDNALAELNSRDVISGAITDTPDF